MIATAPLRDLHQRTVSYLRISVTDRCNLRCLYCMPEAGVAPLSHDSILSYEEILRIASLAVRMGVDKIRVTGGEPLVRRGIVEFMGRLAALPGVRDLSLTSNGLRLDALAGPLHAAGLQRVNISLDTLRGDVFERITRRPGLERVLAGIDAARRAGMQPIKVNVVALRGINDGEILDFAEFARREGVEVRFIEFMPARPDSWAQERFLSAAEILAILGSRYSLTPAPEAASRGPSRSFLLPGGARVGVISPLSEHFCASCNRLRLTAEGGLRSCLFAAGETDLKPLLRPPHGDRELAEAIRQTVQQKPQGHALDEPERHKCGLSMSRIGG